MKKLGCLLFLILFLTGCDAYYNLTINKNTITEDLQIYEEDSSKWNSIVPLFSLNYDEVIKNNLNYKLGIFIDEQLADAEIDNPKYTFYKPSKIETKDKLGIAYNYRFDKDNYERAYFPNNCFDNIKVYNNGGYFTISTSKGFNCIKDDYGLSSLTVNITTKYVVESSNSDSVNGNTQSWIINKNNYEDKNIYIRIDTKKISELENNDENENKVVKIFLTIGISLAILLIIAIIFLINKKRKLEND